MSAAENLRSWLKSEGRMHNWFAEQIGVRPETLSRYLNESAAPSLPVKIVIEKMTGIPKEEWK